ncbi:MAG: type II toxin-antitoxin system prevent-host-death family antitoxin, partial [Candidatus Binatia bacterium]
RGLADTLASLADQSLERSRFEVLVVDNASTAATEAVPRVICGDTSVECVQSDQNLRLDVLSGHAMLSPMKTMGAAKFKEQCLSLLDRLDPEGIVITKHGKPVAKVIPIKTESAALIGALKGKLRIRGDVRSTGLRWDAES